MSYRRILGALFAVMGLLGADAASAATKIRLGYSATSAFATAFVAADQGIFARNGLDVEMVLVPNSSTTPAALLADSLQVATPTPPVTLQAIEAGVDLVVLTGGAVTSERVTDAAVLAREGSGIKEAKDFIGKKVGAPGLNAFLHVLFREWLSDRGVDWKKVSFVEAPFAQLGDILKTGQVDAIVTADPFKTRALDNKAGYLVANYLSEIKPGTAAGWFVAARRWADANRDAAKAFQLSMAQADELAKADPAALRKAIAVYTKLPPEVIAQLPLPALDARLTDAQIDFWSKTCLSQGLTRKPVDASKVIWH